MILVGAVACAAIRHRHRQFALKYHYALAALAIAGTGYHLIQQKSLYRWIVLRAIGLWCVCTMVVFMQAMIAHKPWKHPRPSGGVLWMEVNLPSNRAIRPGQFVQVWVPSAGYRIFTQLRRTGEYV